MKICFRVNELPVIVYEWLYERIGVDKKCIEGR